MYSSQYSFVNKFLPRFQRFDYLTITIRGGCACVLSACDSVCELLQECSCVCSRVPACECVCPCVCVCVCVCV